jgi:5-methyltetrahydropteroyltriglutamate--homocysteine methyltransferase
MNRIFPTQEVGSLAKPSWRIKGFRGEQLSKQEIAEAIIWGRRLGFEKLDGLVQLLSGEDSPRRRQAILEWSARYAIQLLEAAGLDVVFDGEQWRSEMYEQIIKNVTGFAFLGQVKSFDYRYFNKAACVDKPKYVIPFYLDEFLFTKQSTERKIKVPFTGPYTLVDWTFNEFYERKFERTVRDFKRRKLEARKEFLFDVVTNVVRPEIEKLVSAGASWIQMDEPAATTNPSDVEMTLFVEAFNEAVRGLNCTFSLHNCYSNYEVLAKYASELENCSQLSLEFANRDSRQPGTGDARAGYEELKLFEDHGFRGTYGVGVIDVHADFVESPELVRDRILYTAQVVDDPSRICVSTDCGLRTRSWEISFQKLKNMVLGAQLAREAS